MSNGGEKDRQQFAGSQPYSLVECQALNQYGILLCLSSCHCHLHVFQTLRPPLQRYLQRNHRPEGEPETGPNEQVRRASVSTANFSPEFSSNSCDLNFDTAPPRPDVSPRRILRR